MDPDETDYCQVFTALVNSFEDYTQLKHFAFQYGLSDDPQVLNRLQFLLDRNVSLMVTEIDEFQEMYNFSYSNNQDAGPSKKRSKLELSSTSLKTKQTGGSADEKPYYIEQSSKRTFKSTLATDTSFKVKFNERWQGKKLNDILSGLHEMFDDIISKARGHEADLGRVVIQHPDLSNPVVVPLQPWEKLDSDTVMDEISKVLNSEENLHIDENMVVTVGSISLPKGGAKQSITQLFGHGNSIQKKRSLFYVENDNNICLAIAVGLCYLKICERVSVDQFNNLAENVNESRFDKILKHKKISKCFYDKLMDRKRPKLRSELGLRLCQLAELPTTRYLGLSDIPAFEQLLNLNIFVVSSKVGDKFVRIFENDDRPNLFLYHIENETEKHWHGIANIQGFFKGKYFCKSCNQPFNSKHKHSCETSCTVCLDSECRVQKDASMCSSCGRLCRSMACYNRHKIQRTKGKITYPSQCELYYQCESCKKIIKRGERNPEDHECGEWKCPSCQMYHVGQHFCFQRSQPIPDPEKSRKKFIFYDFETRQDAQMTCDEGYSPSKIRCRKCVGNSAPCKSCKTCRNCRENTCGLAQHRVNFAVMQSSCDLCQNEELTPNSKCSNCGRRCGFCGVKDKKTKEFQRDPCSGTCGHRETVFQGDDAIFKFCNYIIQEHIANYVLIAHNAKSFDLYPILETLIERHAIKPNKIIYNGSKIMYMHIANKLNLTFLDSLNFIPMPLAKLPDAFELEELCKGFFPHKFNTLLNQNYIGKYPHPDDYGYNAMSSERRKEFLRWYNEKENETFDFQSEMLKYCRSDVDILRQGCLKFRALLKEVTVGIDPFDYVTIASVCMGIFKTLFLKEEREREITDIVNDKSKWVSQKMENDQEYLLFNDTWIPVGELLQDMNYRIGNTRFRKSSIAAVPSQGYVSRDNYSKLSIQWLEWEMEKKRNEGRQLKIQHALRGGEYKVPGTNYRCDGFDALNNTIYEFYGCAFHGCPTCFPNNRIEIHHPTTKQSLEELYIITMKREAELRSRGFKLITKWEHKFQADIKRHSDLRQYIEHLDIQDRLKPRDSFFGGRTNATKLYHKAQDGESIQYFDFTSLYPYTNKYMRYPIGHPKIIVDNFTDITDYFGIAKVKILPPRGLYHPVLPYTSNGKLKFPLCRTCADEENQTECKCSIEDRCVVGTWCTPEIQLAVKKGYTILKIYEIYHFEESTQYDPTTSEKGLFSDYVNMFLKIKQEASGFPDECDTEEQKREYIRQYTIKEGIELDYNKIKVNKGLRSLAKLCLNSFWGKYGQRLSVKQSRFLHESEVENMFKLLTDPRKDVHNFHIITKDMIQLEWSDDPVFLPFDTKTNIFLASFTTMWARLRLYEVLDILDRDVLYFDTDSVIFRCTDKSTLQKLPIGNYLGELTNEIKPKDGHIIEFVSGGPKNYAYKTKSGKEHCKIRGFTMNWENSKLINFEAVKTMVCTRDLKTIETTNQCKISRHALKRKLYNRVEHKKYKIVYTKRRLLGDLDTVPYGF